MYINLFNTSLKAYHMINFWLSTSSEISIHISLTQMQLKLILIFLEYFDVIVLLLTWQLWGLGRWCVGFPRGVANQSDRPKPGWQLTNRPNISLTAPSKYHYSPTKDLFFCSNLAETGSDALRELPNTRVHCEYASTRKSGSHVVNCGYSYKMSLICRGLIWFRTMILLSERNWNLDRSGCHGNF